MKKDPLSGSKLARTILKTNPGIDRVTGEKLSIVDKISSKKVKVANHQIKTFVNRFECRRVKRQSLYERLKPKLEPSARNAIEKYKVEARLTKVTKPLTLLKTNTKKHKVEHRQSLEQPEQITNIDNENCLTSLEESEDIQGGQDLSRRSSLRSSLLGATRTGSLEGSEVPDNPGAATDEDVETEADESNKMAAYMNLIPAPTPTRFVGKIQQKVREERKKSDSSSRRSSVFPVKETIEESAETEAGNNKVDGEDTKEKEQATDPVPLEADQKASNKSKARIGVLMGNMRKMGRKESVSADNSKSSTPSSSVMGTKDSQSSVPSSASTRKPSDKDKKRGSTGLSSFKAKTGLLGSKTKKKGEKESESSGGKELKHRLFFREKQEPTDDEILAAIGAEQAPKVVGQSINEIAHAATFMKKFLKGRVEDEKPEPKASSSMLYIGALKARLSRTGDDLVKKDDISNLSKTPVIQSTVFLGKMRARKDKFGLIRDGSDNSEEDGESYKDNPVIMALDKVKLKHQTSDDSGSRPASKMSHTR